MRRLCASVSHEYSTLYRIIDLTPEDYVALITGEEVLASFVVRCLV
ncbi:hypothetical protein BN131_2570 [Cronobacter malonaticus 681]|nr:hypothetical protein BN131_2570 [Cronobacter malonaticus 681]